MQILLLPVYIFIAHALGNLINCKFLEKKEKLSLADFAINLVTGFGAHIFLAHLISFITQSFNKSIYIILALAVLSIFIFKNKLKAIELEKYEGWVSIFALIFGFFFAMRDKYFGNPDNFHLIYTASISENEIYPPIFPNGTEMDMSHYHYGVDLIGAAFKTMFAMDLWDAHSFQIFFDVALCIVALYALIKIFVKNTKSASLVLLFSVFYTSINALEFFFKEFTKLGTFSLDIFLKNWLMVSWTAVSHFTSQMRLPSQNCAFFFSFVFVILLVYHFRTKSQWLLASILISAWGLYSSFPAFFYPIVAAYGIFLLYQAHIEFWDEKKFFGPKSRAIVYALIVCVIAKLLTFTSSNVNEEGMKVLVVDPDFSWVHWGKSYVRYFFSMDYLKGLDTAMDYVYPSWHPQIPLFSGITFREFGFSGLLGLFIIVDQLRKKQLNESSLLWFSAFIALMVPMLISFIPREVETTRFLHWTKIAFVIFLAINSLPYIKAFFEEFNFNKSAKLTVQWVFGLLVFITLVPGMVSALPAKSFVLSTKNGVEENTKEFLKEINKIHKTGDICLDNAQFKHGHTLTEMAGYFGVGGQMYKSDDATRLNATFLMNPLLLQELGVDYIFINQDSKLSKQAMARLRDRNLFEPITEIMKNYPEFGFIKFIAQDKIFSEQEKTALLGEYKWTLACHTGKQLDILTNDLNKPYVFNSRQEAKDKLPEIKKLTAKQANLPCAFWLKEQVLTSAQLAGKL